ncbi:MAG: hypothetical protein ABR552_11055 [Actinomycetota bacterium]|nr:hypothetical protein [Actinomycetota bacterium]
MGEEQVQAHLDELEDARTSLIRELESYGTFIGRMRAERADGSITGAMIDPEATKTRDSISNAVQRFSTALARSRSAAIRCLVDDQGWTFTQIAKTIGRTRQLVARLYREVDGQN